jgi:hypothetical protein
MEIETLKDGSVRCTLTIDGITATTIVSSMHLVQEKEPQLRRSIAKQAAEAFEA